MDYSPSGSDWKSLQCIGLTISEQAKEEYKAFMESTIKSIAKKMCVPKEIIGGNHVSLVVIDDPSLEFE